MYRPIRKWLAQPALLLLRAFGPFTFFSLVCALLTFTLFCRGFCRGLLAAPGWCPLEVASPVAEASPVPAFPGSVAVFVLICSPRSFEKREMSIPKSLVRRAISSPPSWKLPSLDPPEWSESLLKRSERSTVVAVSPPVLPPPLVPLVLCLPELLAEEARGLLSYSCLRSGSERTSYACWISLKRPSAEPSPGLASGWCSRTNLRCALRMSSWEAPLDIPSTS